MTSNFLVLEPTCLWSIEVNITMTPVND